MARSVDVYMSETLEAAMANNGGGRGRSHRLSQLADRYRTLLELATVPAFTEAENNLLLHVARDATFEPAQDARAELAALVAGELDRADAPTRWHDIGDPRQLVRRIERMELAALLALIEQLESWWAAARAPREGTNR